MLMRVSIAHGISFTFNIKYIYLALLCRMVDIAKYCLLCKHVKLRFPAKVSVSLKRHTFLRIHIRNQPFIYLQNKDILGFDYEQIFYSILNIHLGN